MRSHRVRRVRRLAAGLAAVALLGPAPPASAQEVEGAEVVARREEPRMQASWTRGARPPAPPTRGRPALFVGDIGDNLDQWPEVAVYRVAEPTRLRDATV